MATVGALKSMLIAKGYEVATSPSLPVAVFTHPLVRAPVVLCGADIDTARPYQEAAVVAAIARR